jgi:predicted TIM-barrel fold metal-dependent hydrolase
MIDDIFVLDGVVHIVDWSFDHVKKDSFVYDAYYNVKAAEISNRLVGGIVDFDQLRGNTIPDSMKGYPDANYELIFKKSPTDMAMVGSLAFGPADEYIEPEYSLKINHRFAAAHPDRCVFVGGVQPYGRDLSFALESIEHQVRDLGARSIKFYPYQWSCDDEAIAYPLFEKCRDLGVKVLQFHLCLPGDSSHNVEMQRPNGLQAPARDFPDLTFVMHHPMPLYFDETVNIATRFPNIYLLISPLLQASLFKPRMVQKMLGELLQQVGSDKLIYGSEGAMAGNPTRYIEALLNFEIPDDLRKGYGYPEITREDREKMLGLNLARLFDIDIETKKIELAAPAARG